MWKHDLGWWGFVLAIATLILAYPLDVLAHLTTPLLKNWWASRSRLTLEERIKSLKAELGLMEMNPAMSETEDMILTSAQVTHVLIWSLGYILVGGSFALDEGGKKSIVMFWALLSLLLLSVNAMVFSFPIHKYRRMRSPRYRRKFATEIEHLENELKKRSI